MSPAVTTYPVQVPGILRVLVAAILALLAAVGLVVLVRAVSSPTSPAWLLVFAVVWLAAVVAVLLRVLALPIRIELGADGVASFVCTTRIVRVPLSTILAVRRTGGPAGFLVVAHDRGTVRLPGRLGDLDDFVTRVKAASTRAAIVGL
jgi:hypothetical protein